MMTSTERKEAVKCLIGMELNLAELVGIEGWWRHLGRERQRWVSEFRTFLVQARLELGGGPVGESVRRDTFMTGGPE